MELWGPSIRNMFETVMSIQDSTKKEIKMLLFSQFSLSHSVTHFEQLFAKKIWEENKKREAKCERNNADNVPPTQPAFFATCFAYYHFHVICLFINERRVFNVLCATQYQQQ